MTTIELCEKKKKALFAELRQFKSLLVAFSGGVDSTLLLAAAKEVLKDKAAAVTAVSPVMSKMEVDAAIQLAKHLGVKHLLMTADIMDHENFLENTKNRCGICKKIIFSKLRQKAEELHIADIAHGVNVDDLDDYRPGIAAAEKLGIHAPLVKAGLGKQDIRMLSKKMGLPNWEKPAMACLASRIPYGTPISGPRLKMIEQAENILVDNGFTGCRVRHHDQIARIEVCEKDFKRLADPHVREQIVRDLKAIGFLYVALDLEGYVQGSLNRG